VRASQPAGRGVTSSRESWGVGGVAEVYRPRTIVRVVREARVRVGEGFGRCASVRGRARICQLRLWRVRARGLTFFCCLPAWRYGRSKNKKITEGRISVGVGGERGSDLLHVLAPML